MALMEDPFDVLDPMVAAFVISRYYRHIFLLKNHLTDYRTMNYRITEYFHRLRDFPQTSLSNHKFYICIFAEKKNFKFETR